MYPESTVEISLLSSTVGTRISLGDSCTSCGIGKEKEVILINDDDDYTVTYNHINTEQTTNKMAASDQTVVMDLDKLEDWCCRRCTLNNSSDKTRCEMCESPREIRVPTVDDSNDISTVDSGYMTSNRRGEPSQFLHCSLNSGFF
jgi:hypothetical protein